MVKHAGGVLLPTLTIEPGAGTPMTAQLACSLRDLILSGDLQPGQRLPSSRTLAKDLGISRTTAVNVYDQLAAEGLIHSRVGAGAFVSDALENNRPPSFRQPRSRDAQSRRVPRLARLSADASEKYFPRLSHPGSPRAFITGLPAFDAFPKALWARLSAKHWRDSLSHELSYPDAHGLVDLRWAIAAHLRANRGIACTPDEVFIFNGAQDAFNRIGNMVLNPGDRVWFENPGAIGARNSLISCGARLVPVPVDEAGLSVEAGLRLAPDFRLAFVTPAHQHPLGVTMSLPRRFELLRAAERAEAWIVEDDYVGEFHYSDRPPPTLKSVDRSGRVIYVGTFSKTLFPALRLGYVVAPPDLAETFQRIAGATMQGAPTNLQAVVARFIEDGHFAAHIRRMRRLYAERQEALIEAARRDLAPLLQVEATNTGLHTIGRLTAGFDETQVALRAAERGIVVAPIERFAIAPVAQKGLVLGFSAIAPRAIEAGVGGLARLLHDMRADRA
jgi:GntR family transcriptional regulator/MocR family aminotransferase